MSINYWIAQYVEDVFRREPRNVGVFVESEGAVAARFFGAGEGDQIDGRKLRGRIEYPDVYRQWVDYWRSEIKCNSIASVLAASGSHYRVIDGGCVDDVASGELADVANYLYALLVSDGGIGEALGITEEDQAVAYLAAEVADAFKAANLMAGVDAVVQHPIKHLAPITGKLNIEHKPAFSQENGKLYVMETIDFTTKKKRNARDHAGWSAYMFGDIRDLRPTAEPIAIVRFTEADTGEEEVRNGLALLRNESRVVNWLENEERLLFLAERRETATS